MKLMVESDTTVVVTRRFDAPRELVFEAWTKPEHLRKWFAGPDHMTLSVCEVEMKPGGKLHYEWTAGGAKVMSISGVMREFSPPSRMVSTEHWEGWPDTENTIDFAEDNGGTLLTMTIVYPSRAARDAAMATPMESGLTQGFAKLDAYLLSIS